MVLTQIRQKRLPLGTSSRSVEPVKETYPASSKARRSYESSWVNFWWHWGQTLVQRAFFLEDTVQRGQPRLRGKIHLLLVYLAPIWIFTLYHSCHTPSAWIATSVSVFCSLFNFTASALLHNKTWSTESIEWITRLDYIGIFIMISGSCSPVPVLLMTRKLCVAFLCLQWAVAFIGICATVSGYYSKHGSGLRATVYIAMGLLNGLFFNVMYDRLSVFELACVISLGLFYIFGAVCYAVQAPNLWPEVIGYHEIFHGCCFVSAVCTYLLNKSVLLRAD